MGPISAHAMEGPKPLSARCVPAAYPRWAFLSFLEFLACRRLNNLRACNPRRGFDPPPRYHISNDLIENENAYGSC